MKKYNWIPNQSFGDIKFNDDIEIYNIRNNAFLKEAADSITGLETYAFPDDDYLSLYVKNEIVNAITHDLKCFYKDKNIIGMPLDVLYEVLGIEPDSIGTDTEFENGEIHVCYEFYDLGLQAWVCENKVNNVCLSTYPED